MRVRLLGVGLLVEACAASHGPAGMADLPTRPPQPDHVVAHGAPPVENPASSTAARAVNVTPPATAVGASGSAPTVVPAPVLVLIEPPYSALGHPRLPSEMLTLARDDELFQWALGGSADPEHPSNRPGYHPATRVVVDVQLLSRAPKAAAKRLLRVARSSGYWPLRACFEAAQRVAPKPERAARVRLTLSASGRVLGSRSMGAAPERDYARCVRDGVRGLDFTPGFTRKLDVDISAKLWPGHAPIPPRAPDGSTAVRLPAAAAASLEAVAPALTACYQKGLASDPQLWGRIALRLELSSDGAVRLATPVETRFPSAEVAECARQALLSARLDSPGVSELTFAVRLGQLPPPVPSPPLAAPAVSVDPAPPAPPAPPVPESH